jgi:hypothetical protein
MFRQWKIAFEIGAANKERGVQPMRFSAFVTLLASRVMRKPASGVISTPEAATERAVSAQ